MYFVYAIYNQEHNRIYIGQTKNFVERLKMHNEHILGGYTSRYSGEWKLIYKEKIASRQQALIRERQLKSFRGREFIWKQIKNQS